MRSHRFGCAAVLALLLTACAAPMLPPLPNTQIIVFGEQHDQPDHQRQTEQALRRLAAGFQEATGLAVHLELPGKTCEVTASQRLALYRTAQEGLTNIQRHAAAHQAWLRLECSPDRITMQVMDDGRGLPTGNGLPAGKPGAGFGLRGLRERAAQLDGAITLDNRPGGGTILAIQLPIQEG